MGTWLNRTWWALIVALLLSIVTTGDDRATLAVFLVFARWFAKELMKIKFTFKNRSS